MSKIIFKSIKPVKEDKHYNPKELEMGIKVEMEHTTNKETAKKIAKHHLDEDKNYYSKHKKFEEGFKKERCKKCGKTESKCKCEIKKSNEISFDLIKGKAAEVGEVRTYKDGTKRKKVAPGKWEVIKDGKGKPKKKPEGKPSEKPEEGQEQKNVYQQLDKLNDKQRSEIAKMISSKKTSDEINEKIKEFEEQNKSPEAKKNKTINDAINSLAIKKAKAVLSKMADTLASFMGGSEQEVVEGTGRTAEELKKENMNPKKKVKELNKSIEDVFDLIKGRKALPIGTKKYYGDKEHIKTAKGWRPTGKKKSEQQKVKEEVKKVSEDKRTTDQKIADKLEDSIKRIIKDVTGGEAVQKMVDFLVKFKKTDLGKDLVPIFKKEKDLTSMSKIYEYVNGLKAGQAKEEPKKKEDKKPEEKNVNDMTKEELEEKIS
jgi:hypothetical protein